MFYDLIAFGISYILIQSYYFYLIRRTRCAPQSSVHALNARTRERWVKMIMSGEKLDILAIQTVRNSVMAANFMATTAILLLVGVLNLGEKIGLWAEKLHPFCTVCNPASELWMLKLGM